MNTTHRLVAGLVSGAFLTTMLACIFPGGVCPVGQGVASQPAVQITQPADGTVVEPGQTVPIVAVASDPAGLTRLEIAVDGATLATQTSPQPAPQLAARTTWSSTVPGDHVVVASAFGASGQVYQSAPVMMRVQTASAQGTTPVPPSSGNRAPIITSLTASPETMEAGGTAALSVSAYDPDGDLLSYSWDVPPERGTVVGGANATYTAPSEPSKVGTCTITAIVSDSGGVVAAKSVDVTIKRPVSLHDPGPAFQPTWGGDPALQDKLGWATEPQRDLPPKAAGPQAVEQPFQRGRMFWYGDVRLIYALYQDDHKWQVFSDTFSWADPTPTPLPPTGCTAPLQGGFRKVWWNESGVRARIGCPLQGETGVKGTVQRFQRGIMIESGLNGRVFVLFDVPGGEGTWQ